MLYSEEVVLHAASVADWGQVVANGGPPCFAIHDGEFCFRTPSWEGHRNDVHHRFLTLGQLLETEESAGIRALATQIVENYGIDSAHVESLTHDLTNVVPVLFPGMRSLTADEAEGLSRYYKRKFNKV